MERRFDLVLKEDVARKMNKSAYREAMRWLRTVRKILLQKINWPVFDRYVVDSLGYGRFVADKRELIKL